MSQHGCKQVTVGDVSLTECLNGDVEVRNLRFGRSSGRPIVDGEDVIRIPQKARAPFAVLLLTSEIITKQEIENFIHCNQ